MTDQMDLAGTQFLILGQSFLPHVHVGQTTMSPTLASNKWLGKECEEHENNWVIIPLVYLRSSWGR